MFINTTSFSTLLYFPDVNDKAGVPMGEFPLNNVYGGRV
jgi:hypothetical protein